jgi:hypothetical protein
MPRTVVPPLQYRGPRSRPVGGDGLPERLVKYVPAETLGFFVPIAAGIGNHRDAWLIGVIVAGFIGSIGYMWLAARRLTVERRPLPHFYFLAGLAFLCWAVGTSPNVSALIRIDQVEAGTVLGLAVFLIPLLDEVGNRWLRRSP